MLKVKRNIDFYQYISKKSFFLLGPRSTGKSFWIKETLSKNALYINLLQGALHHRLLERPEILEEMLDNENVKWCIIDEIQKNPNLLDEVHRLIEDRGFHFMLTGSSARKLKRSNANMLGGRASMINFFPLSYHEIPKFDLDRYLLVGGLPKIYLSNDPFSELADYISLYLEQEVQLEANIRNIGPFQRFLKTAAFHSGEMIQYTNVSKDSGVPLSTVKEYFQILSDTLIGYVLEPWIESKKRKAIQTAKFYFFDTGVLNALLDVNSLDRASERWGRLFESFLLSEVRAFNSYFQKNKKLYYWRSVNKQEVDFIIGDEVAIEVKSAAKIDDRHLSGLRALMEENKIKKFMIVSNDKIEREKDGIQIIYWKNFLKKLWAGEVF